MLHFGDPMEAASTSSMLSMNSESSAAQESLPGRTSMSSHDSLPPIPPRNPLRVDPVRGSQSTNDIVIDDLIKELEGLQIPATSDCNTKVHSQPLSPAPKVDSNTKPNLLKPAKQTSPGSREVRSTQKKPRAKIAASAAWSQLGSPDYHFVDEDRVVRR